MNSKRNKNHTFFWILSVVIILLALFIGFCILMSQKQNSVLSSSSSSVSITSKPDDVVSLVAAGDNLIHNNIYNQAYQRTGGKGYNFMPAYEHIASLIRGNDFALLNQETILAGSIYPLSNYPLFNSPTEVGDTAVSLGFNVITHANNHVLDKGENGLRAALTYWSTKSGISVIGAFQNQEDMDRIRVVEKNNVKIAFIGITDMTNGLSLSKNSDYRILYSKDLDRIESQIKKAKTLSDFIVVTIHWGDEYSLKQNARQTEMAQKMADWGADLIIGHHPHVLQPIDTIQSEDGRIVPVYYSLGNFISMMVNTSTMLGGIADVQITKNYQTGITSITDLKLIPIITHYGNNGSSLTVYPLADYTHELSLKHGVKAFDNTFSYDAVLKVFNTVVEKKYQLLEGEK